LFERGLVKVQESFRVENFIAANDSNAAGVLTEVNAHADRGKEFSDTLLELPSTLAGRPVHRVPGEAAYA
jgi:hypothetical protein